MPIITSSEKFPLSPSSYPCRPVESLAAKALKLHTQLTVLSAVDPHILKHSSLEAPSRFHPTSLLSFILHSTPVSFRPFTPLKLFLPRSLRVSVPPNSRVTCPWLSDQISQQDPHLGQHPPLKHFIVLAPVTTQAVHFYSYFPSFSFEASFIGSSSLLGSNSNCWHAPDTL